MQSAFQHFRAAFTPHPPTHWQAFKHGMRRGVFLLTLWRADVHTLYYVEYGIYGSRRVNDKESTMTHSFIKRNNLKDK